MNATSSLKTGIPAVGLGLWKVPQQEAASVVQSAIEMGYRHLDAACDYGNEVEVGEGIAQAIQRGMCRRDELWITSKLWNTYHAPEHVRPAVERTLRDLKLDYLDLYLIHFPIALQYVPFAERYPPGWIADPDASKPCMVPVRIPQIATWHAMEELVEAGLVRHLGVSNFGVGLLNELLSQASILPAVLQVEMHPYLSQAKLLRYCQQMGIDVTAFSPLGAGSYVPLGMAQGTDSVLCHPLITDMAKRYGRSPAQIVLRWGIQRGVSVVPKSRQLERLRENLQVMDWSLEPADMVLIDGLDCGRRFNDPGVFCEQAFGCFYPIYE